MALLIFAAPAVAQDGNALRGELSETAINGELLPQNRGAASAQSPATTGQAAPAYRPASEGALPDPDPDLDPSLDPFAAENTDDVTADQGFGMSSDDGALAPDRLPARDRTERAERDASGSENSADDSQAADNEASTDDDATEEDATGAIEPVERVESETQEPIDPRTGKVEPIEGLPRRVDEDPYAPLGLRIGSFNLFSTLEQGLNWTSNVNFSEDAQSALQSETSLNFRAESDWARHAARLEAFGTLRETIDGPKVDDNDVGFNGELRLDLADDLRAIASLNYLTSPESASSPIVIVGAASRPTRQLLGGAVGLEKDVGKLRFSVTGSLLDESYGDATLEDGTKLSQKDRDSLLALVRLRTGYETSSAVMPFVEVEVGQRKYDMAADSAGYRRSSDHFAWRGGVALDMGEKLRGEIAAGWLRENPDDERLAAISTPSIEANLHWSPARGTDVLLQGATTVETTNAPDESGSVLYSGRLGVERQIRANLTGNLMLGAEWRDYVGTDAHDLTLSAELGMTWWWNRYFGLTGRARHEQQTSNLPGREITADSVFLGLRLQR